MPSAEMIVTLATGTTKRYALCLTKLAESTRFGTHQALASGAWMSKTQLSRRISMLLDNKQNRTDRVSIVDCAVRLVALGGSLLVFSQAGQVIAAENAKAAPDSAIRT